MVPRPPEPTDKMSNTSAGQSLPNAVAAPPPTSSGEPQNVEDLAHLIQNLLQQTQDRFQSMSDTIIKRIDEMGRRIDDLERNINELMTQAGVEDGGGS